MRFGGGVLVGCEIHGWYVVERDLVGSGGRCSGKAATQG